MAKTEDDAPVTVPEASTARTVEDRIEELRRRKAALLDAHRRRPCAGSTSGAS